MSSGKVPNGKAKMKTDQLNKLCNVEIPRMDNYSLLRIICIATMTMGERLMGDDKKFRETYDLFLSHCDGSVDDLIPEVLLEVSAGAWSFANNRR